MILVIHFLYRFKIYLESESSEEERKINRLVRDDGLSSEEEKVSLPKHLDVGEFDGDIAQKQSKSIL